MHTLSLLTDEQKTKMRLCARLKCALTIAPSERLDTIARRHISSLPRPVRMLLAGIGATEVRGAALASYLLFEKSYTCELIALGRKDAMVHKNEILAFFASQARDDNGVSGAESTGI